MRATRSGTRSLAAYATGPAPLCATTTARSDDGVFATTSAIAATWSSSRTPPRSLPVESSPGNVTAVT
ncbi:hypothetical protein MLGJGCBP_00466 [Rhodococcus sp. T7]|nr:hypothetical protein MLGJGCBP_00466 [Rhodococcus sp. T7]